MQCFIFGLQLDIRRKNFCKRRSDLLAGLKETVNKLELVGKIQSLGIVVVLDILRK